MLSEPKTNIEGHILQTIEAAAKSPETRQKGVTLLQISKFQSRNCGYNEEHRPACGAIKAWMERRGPERLPRGVFWDPEPDVDKRDEGIPHPGKLRFTF